MVGSHGESQCLDNEAGKMVESMETPIHMVRAGEFFMYTLWLQSQMADLLILNKDRTLVEERMNDSSRIPQRMVMARAQYMHKNFDLVLTEFKKAFKKVLSNDDVCDLAKIRLLRDMIAHSHVSVGREFLLHSPNHRSKLEHIKRHFALGEIPNQPEPPQMKLDFGNNDRFLNDFALIKRIDEDCFAKVAQLVGISHSRIR